MDFHFQVPWDAHKPMRQPMVCGPSHRIHEALEIPDGTIHGNIKYLCDVAWGVSTDKTKCQLAKSSSVAERFTNRRLSYIETSKRGT